MYLTVIGLTLGLIIGTFLQVNIPAEYARYTAVAIVGIVDSLFGAVRASVEKKYNLSIFMTGLTFNMLIGILFVFIGDELNLDIYMAVLIAFTIRIFSNIGIIKAATVEKMFNRTGKIADKIEN